MLASVGINGYIGGAGTTRHEHMEHLVRNGRVLIGGFGLLAVVGTAVAVLLLGGGGTELLFGFGAGLAVAIAVVGVYALGRRSGHPHSHAVAEASVTLGVVFIIAIVYRLLTEFGA